MIRKNRTGRFYLLPLIILTIIIVSLPLYSTRESDSKAADPAAMRSELMAGLLLEREDPFIQRTFDPYLNGTWIGNAVSYGPYRKGQAPGGVGPSREDIIEDLKILSEHWNLIRVYNADDDTELILSSIKETGLPIKVMLGVWLENETDLEEKKAANITNVLRAVELANKYSDEIAAVNVGNETQVFWSWHKMSTADLIRYIRFVRANISLPVTTADDYNFWNKPESRPVADEIDFIVTHIYPLWNGKTLAESIPWLNENYKLLKIFHPEKDIVLGEIGWATDYNAEKKGDGEQGSLIKGKVGVETQSEFIVKLYDWSTINQVTTFLFEAFDEPWKGGGENTGPREIEKNWGVFYEDRTPKRSFQKFIDNKTKETKEKK